MSDSSQDRTARTNRASKRMLYCFVAAALLSIPTIAVADEVFSLGLTVSIPGLASFDISYVDPSVHAYFLSDRTDKTIDVIDTVTKVHSTLDAGGFVGAVGTPVNNNISGPNGVMTVHQGDNHGGWDWDHHGGRTEVWAGDGNSTVKVLDYPSGAVLHTIATNGQDRADEMCWDPDDHLALVANDADSPPFISFISTDNYKVIKQMKFDGLAGDGPNATNGIEQCKYNAREHAFYINVPEVNGSGSDTAPGNTLVINPHTLKIVQTFVIPIADCAGPQGMAIGPAPQIALGCNAPSIPGGVRNSVVINEENGHVIATLANEGGTDEAWFNPGDGHYFFANSTPGSKASPPTPQFLGVVDSRGDQEDQTVVTQASSAVGAHSVAADPRENAAYVPVANGVNIYFPNGPDDHFVYRGH